MKGKLSIKEQLRLVKNKCPDMWEIFMDGCPSEYGLPEMEIPCMGRDYATECRECWNKALEDDK